jgi:hypothetical protein
MCFHGEPPIMLGSINETNLWLNTSSCLMNEHGLIDFNNYWESQLLYEMEKNLYEYQSTYD